MDTAVIPIKMQVTRPTIVTFIALFLQKLCVLFVVKSNDAGSKSFGTDELEPQSVLCRDAFEQAGSSAGDDGVDDKMVFVDESAVGKLGSNAQTTSGDVFSGQLLKCDHLF